MIVNAKQTSHARILAGFAGASQTLRRNKIAIRAILAKNAEIVGEADD